MEGENDALAIIGTAVVAIGFLAVGPWWIGVLLLVLLAILIACVLPAHW